MARWIKVFYSSDEGESHAIFDGHVFTMDEAIREIEDMGFEIVDALYSVEAK